MRVGIYTLDKEDLNTMSAYMPDYVIDRAHDPGYFSLGAVSTIDDVDRIVGAAQFYIDINSSGECFAYLIYTYVMEEFRRSGVGSKLIDKIGTILKKSDVRMCVVRLPEKKDVFLYKDTSKGDVEKFIKSCDFMATKENIVGETLPDTTENIAKYIRLTSR